MKDPSDTVIILAGRRWLTDRGVEAYTKGILTRSILVRQRWEKTGMPYLKLGKRALYDEAVIDAHIEAHIVNPTPSAPKPPRKPANVIRTGKAGRPRHAVEDMTDAELLDRAAQP